MSRTQLYVLAGLAFLFLRRRKAAAAEGLSEEEVAAREAEAATFEDESGNPLTEREDGTFAPAIAPPAPDVEIF